MRRTGRLACHSHLSPRSESKHGQVLAEETPTFPWATPSLVTTVVPLPTPTQLPLEQNPWNQAVPASQIHAGKSSCKMAGDLPRHH